MKRRPKTVPEGRYVVPPRIAVEERTREQRWCDAGRKLFELERCGDFHRFDKALALAEAYVAAAETDDDDLFAGELMRAGTPWTFEIKWREN